MVQEKNTGKLDLSGESIHWDMDMDYAQYLKLDDVLGAQRPISGEHDEMLFIVIHHVMELWMKLVHHELDAAVKLISEDDLKPSFKMFSRVARIHTQMIGAWDVLTTMTPADYLKFRDTLGRSSGFQSVQFRLLEYKIGNKVPELAKVHQGKPDNYQRLQAALKAPSLYDVVIGLLARRGFAIDEALLSRDFDQPYVENDSVRAAWHTVYSDTENHWELYELAEKLMDFEHNFQMWRYHHLKTVERIIGNKMGTGGSSGLPYLAQGVLANLFPELMTVRTEL